jgi:acetylornithine deacetylase/succinyl-diaminopimelate desuccinylase-like protein
MSMANGRAPSGASSWPLPSPLPEVAIDWDAATDACVEHLRALIRIPSVNPPGDPASAGGRDSTGGETAAATYCADVLSAAGIEAEVLEAEPGRGSCFARLRADVPDPEPPIVLLSHIDVVPVDAESWSRDPFGGELVGGEVWGRGACDMKEMVAMELSVMLALHASGAALRRDVIFAAVADEEAGGTAGALHWVHARPDLFTDASGRPAVAALNEVGGYSMTVAGRRIYTIQVAEKGIIWTRLRATGTPSHGSMPSPDNAAIKLAEAVTRLAAAPRPARLVPVVRRFFDGLGLSEVADLAERGEDDGARARLREAVPDPVLQRSLDAMLRDTVTPNVIHVGKKVNVVPGSGEAEVDVRTLPGTDPEAFLAELQRVAGDAVTVESVHTMPPVEGAPDSEIVGVMEAVLREADPEGEPLPMMITLGTDGKAMGLLGIPTYGFMPLRLEPDQPYLSLYHANDERIPVSAIEFGLLVLGEVVHRFAVAE